MLHVPSEMPIASSAYILAADPYLGQDGVEALTGAGFRLSGSTTALDDLVALDLIYLDLRGADLSEIMALADPAMAARARFSASLIVRFGPDQMDVVFSAIDGSGAELLCDPSPVELAAALALHRHSPCRNRVRETDDEAERLKRLNDEVARIAETLARLVKHEQIPPAPAHVSDRRMAYKPVVETDSFAVSSSRVRNVIRARRLRDQFFAASLFADPAWDMLLDLFAAELEHTRVSVSSLCIAAAVPPTTALRWIAALTSHDLIEREPDLQDRRRAHIKLSARAGIAMRGYFNALDRAALAAI